MLLQLEAGNTLATLSPALASLLKMESNDSALTEGDFRKTLEKSNASLHDADNIYYFKEKDAALLEIDVRARQLTSDDADAFLAFQKLSTEEDLDGAYVELDHWAVFGLFEGNTLVCAASMYPWDDARIADLGVLTAEQYRGKGYAVKLVRSICRYALDQGYTPQYRCQLDNLASVGLAKAAGLSHFGKWEVISPNSTHSTLETLVH